MKERCGYNTPGGVDTPSGTGKNAAMVYDRIRSLIESLRDGLVERDEALRLSLLSALAGESIALLGPAGVGKSLVSRRAMGAFQSAPRFEIALDGFTTPDELFGPLSLERIKRGEEGLRETKGYLPEAQLISIENIWNGSRAVRDAILPVIADRKFRNGSRVEPVSWCLLVGTADYLPPIEEVSRPFWDRFLLRVELEPVGTPENFRKVLLSEGPPEIPGELKITEKEWARWNEEIASVELTEEVLGLIGRVRQVLTEHNRERLERKEPPIYVSDRRWHELTRILKASAYFHGRDRVDPLDCVLLRHGLWERPEQIEEVNTIIRAAIVDHAQSDRFDTQRLRLEFRRLSDEIENHRIDYREEEVREFERYRGEYFIIEEFIEDLTTLIWIDDFQNLSTETPKTVELFFYGEDDVLSHTDTFMVRRAGEESVEVNGDIFPLKGTDVSRSVAERRPLSGKEAGEFRQRLTGLLDACRTRIEEIAAIRTAGESESFEHLFVKREYAKLLLDGLEESEKVLTNLESEMSAYEAEAFAAT
jgi:MoxR-like ATPase